ncbi:excalibur calcium-binding domain-containing protein [Leptolyngbya cf. ectocarpi LEGE 11479]|uniref:Excalibur calcium-binding domain-containing protein n=1 Tax=Leptolyngbya cf. ectocarpi LEGE 11479 TaxID=1828722 RepID=A0A928ZYP6_LEPEC|nr:excalibur calcium-binding domain-containing protein [Leptolyngbya ectocarpi]MBE9069885.1 excalibur calcium-binding domain-containing protein [Leptolyngbya cf. ectocarpi LEGE 11479]
MKIVLAVLTTFQLFASVAIAQGSVTCDPHYSGVCIPVYRTEADDVDCSDIEEKNFAVVTIGKDPHKLDRDQDGVACEAQS